MKRIVALLLTLSIMIGIQTAFAGDVSGFENHATIDSTPFKDDFFSVKFNNISYTADINGESILVAESSSGSTYWICPYIRMSTSDSVQHYYPWIGVSSTLANYCSYFYVKIGENRYRIDISSTYEDSAVGKELYMVLSEAATTEMEVLIYFPGFTRSENVLSKEDITRLKTFVDALNTSGIADDLPYENNVKVITNYN